MEIRTITRSSVGELRGILRAAGPHGHREWQTTDEKSLLAMLENPRLDPDLGRWSIAYEGGTAVGYALAEPELNIGRMLVGLAVIDGHEDAFDPLLADGIERATTIANRGEFEVHVAVRDTESEAVKGVLRASGFDVVRTVLKMAVDVTCVELQDAKVPDGLVVRDADMSDAEEAAAVTDLHNACFIDSWGFSPNTVDEITGRATADADRNGFAPIVVLARVEDGELSGYNWITLNDGDGRVEMVGVHPSMRGKRLGRTIFNAGVEQLIAQGATRLVLDVDAENPPARSIYESAGYRTYSEVKYYGLKVAV